MTRLIDITLFISPVYPQGRRRFGTYSGQIDRSASQYIRPGTKLSLCDLTPRRCSKYPLRKSSHFYTFGWQGPTIGIDIDFSQMTVLLSGSQYRSILSTFRAVISFFPDSLKENQSEIPTRIIGKLSSTTDLERLVGIHP